MCSIAGVYNYRSQRPVLADTLQDMNRVVIHRGPDGGDVFTQDTIGLAHRRLSILDLTDSGKQPMTSIDGRFTITFNGEIYNYRELKKTFLQDYPLNSQTDTEVLLGLYTKMGSDCLQHLNGMFAFAVWDNQQKTLFIVRDRLGIKPLYYTQTEDGIAFSSELKSLLTLDELDRTIDKDQIYLYMHYGYIPGSQTILKNIQRLEPGHLMHISASGVTTKNYWQLEHEPEQDRGESTYIEEFKHLFDDAIQLRLRSDVPLGILLSGGLDSSAVVAQLSQHSTQQLKTFSVGYDYGREFNESNYARIVAQEFNTQHEEHFMTPQRFLDLIPEFIWHMDEPVTEAAAISLYYLSQKIKNQVTVVLSGEGADEMLGGYDIYKYFSWIQQYRKLPYSVRKLLIEKPLSVLGNKKINKYITLAQDELVKTYMGVSLYESEMIHNVLTPSFLDDVDESIISRNLANYHNPNIKDPLNQMLNFDTKTWLVDNLLIKADKMTMAPSLELRVPFLDYRLVEFCGRLPTHYKINQGNKKYLLKKSMGNLLPKTILKRKKVGFPTPLKDMFQKDLYPFVRDTLSSQAFKSRGIFNQTYVTHMLDRHKQGAGDFHRELWQLLVLELWFQKFSQ